MRKPESDGGRLIPLSERTVERTQGCWNCKHYAKGDLVRARLRECRQRDLASKIAEVGYLPTYAKLGDMEIPDVPGGPKDARYQHWEKAAAMGVIGMCMIGAVADDFVHHQYFCDKWTGAEGASVAREGAKPDKLPEEILAEVEGRAKKPIGG